MKFYPDKCKVLVITNKRKIIVFDYKIHNKCLHKVDHAKYLGAHIDKKLLCKYHVSSITSKANHCTHFLQRNLVTCNRETKLHCYKTFVHPIVEYASSVWNPVGNKQLQYHLDQVQKKAARWTESNWHYKSSASNMVQNLGLNSLAVRGEIACLKLLHSIYYNKKFLQDSVIPKYARCADTRFKPITGRVQDYSNSFVFPTTEQWNPLPANIANIDCLVKFSEKLSDLIK